MAHRWGSSWNLSLFWLLLYIFAIRGCGIALILTLRSRGGVD